MAVSIIGGTITSTLLTLLVIPSFYDSIERKREHLIEKFLARQARWNVLISLGVTGLEVLATLLGVRLIYRGLKAVSGRFFGMSRASA
jgi:hypothetical protein